MIFETPTIILKLAIDASNDTEQIERFSDSYRSFYDDERTVSINTDHYKIEDFLLLQKIIDDQVVELEEELKTTNDKHQKALLVIYNKWTRKFKSYNDIISNARNKKIGQLNFLPTAFDQLIAELPHHLFFKVVGENDYLVAYVPESAKYNAAEQYQEAHTTFKFKYLIDNSVQTASFSVNKADLSKHKTLVDLLLANGFMLETEDLYEEFNRTQQIFAERQKELGAVYEGIGSCIRRSSSRYGYRYSSDYFFTGDQNLMVIDHEGYDLEEGNDRNKSAAQYHYIKQIDKTVQLPIHPFITAFHLSDHTWLSVHVDAMTKYEFKGESLLDKLVLPEDHKHLIHLLMNNSKLEIEDIVKGKKGGSFIMATGNPGTGKTLTAEVISEVIERPLYKVQCSQLGIDVSSVEKRLSKILSRSARWGSILLIDEADVYVRARGVDIQQNAIVGVFLRTLEYYTGILFMTSNLETQIDDAIMSRATAHIQYKAPTTEHLRKIWEILNDQMNANMSDEDIQKCVEAYPNIVGRDVKSLIKLGLMFVSNQKRPLDFKTIQLISKFTPAVRTSINVRQLNRKEFSSVDES